MTAAADDAPPLPSQNQLYAVYMNACMHHRVRKPNAAILALLADPDAELAAPSPSSTAAASLRVADADGGDASPAKHDVAAAPTAAGPAAADAAPAADAFVPLAQRTALPLRAATVHYGNKALRVLLDLMAHLPLLECVDWTGCRIFDQDCMKRGVPGNELLAGLCAWGGRQRALRSVDLGGNVVGTVGAHALTAMLRANGGVVALALDESAIDAVVLRNLRRALDDNRSGANTARPPVYAMSAELRALDEVDRKTSTDHRMLHHLMWEHTDVFAALGEAATNAFVFRAASCPTAEVTNACRGLRGDGSNFFVVDSGEVVATIGGQQVALGRGDYFGEQLDSVMYVAGQLSVGQRGVVFRVPYAVARPLFTAWETAVTLHLPVLKNCPVLQGLPMWVLIRLCHGAAKTVVPAGELAVTKGDVFRGLLVVVSGAFMVRDRAGRGIPDFTAGDVIGHEAAVARAGKSPVDIKAVVPGEADAVLLVVGAKAATQFALPLLRTTLATVTKAYCHL
jgi:hypothetical protein